MSSGLMSCVRENSPPLEMEADDSLGALSLPETSMTEAAEPTAAASTWLAPMSPGAMSANCNSAASTVEQQKRRRFHPLRNLRRIFRRRTITSGGPDCTAAAPLDNNEPTRGEKNGDSVCVATSGKKGLRSATLSAISSLRPGLASVSSPCSPLHTTAYSGSKSLPKNKSSGAGVQRNVLVVTTEPRKHHGNQQQLKSTPELQQHHHHYYYKLENAETDVMFSAAQTEAAEESSQQHVYNMSSLFSPDTSSERHSLAAAAHRSSAATSMGGIAVLPSAFNAAALHRSFFAERQKLKKGFGDSAQELEGSAASSLGSTTQRSHNVAGISGIHEAHEMTDNQRSFSEGRLMESDYGRDGLSQSHDSVFSESATASSLSIVLKSELADALRKRRNNNRPDASEEDLGLPRSPVSPIRRQERNTAACIPNASTPNTSVVTGNHSEVSSLSMLSMNSTDGDVLCTDVTSGTQERSITTSTASKHSRISTTSQSQSGASDVSRQSSISNKGDIGESDGIRSDWQRLSHSAAKHKMSVRPTKKKGPSRHHRRPLETPILEANEETGKYVGPVTDSPSHEPNINATRKEQALTEDSKMQSSTAGGENINKNLPNKTTNNKKNNSPPPPFSSSNNNSASSIPSAAAPSSKKAPPLATTTGKVLSVFEPRSEDRSTENIADEEMQSSSGVETSENNFIRRLIQRNSKRSISKANSDDVPDTLGLGPKKIQIPSTAYDNRELTKLTPISLDKSKNEFVCEQKIEESYKDIKSDISFETITEISGKLSSHSTTTLVSNAVSPSKPKSGPAARQRCLPKEIPSNSTLERSKRIISDVLANESLSNIPLAKPLQVESFQSTSIIRQITASQVGMNAKLKTDSHFEKKPKIIGLSSFQQKISRSNDLCTRSNTNTTSSTFMDISGGFFLSPDQKSRKSVEKSRSFRTYNEDRDLNAGVHNNMPSLPDLSLQLPPFGEFILNEKEYNSPSPPDRNGQSTSLGFEINDNNLVRPPLKSEVSSILTPFTQNIITPHKNIVKATKPSPPPKLLAAPNAGILPNLSPTNSIAEIEQTIDMIVKSPFVSVFRKSANISDETAELIKLPNAIGQSSEQAALTKVRLSNNDNSRLGYYNSMPKESKRGEDSTAVPISAVREKAPSATMNGKLHAEFTERKEGERKSIGTANPSTLASKANSFNSTRRSTSVIDGSTDEKPTVLEFMKIQLNRVDPGARALKSTVVFAKNIKETTPKETTPASERSASIGDLSSRRFSNDNVEMSEHESPKTEKTVTCLFQAIDRQTKSLSTSSIRFKEIELPPKSPAKTTTKIPTTPTKPPAKLHLADNSPKPLTPSDTNQVMPGRAKTPTTPTEEAMVILRQKPSAESADSMSANKLSLQERKRLFMNEDKTKVDKKVEDLKNELKKSINEEMHRKSIGTNKNEAKDAKSMEPNVEKEVVILRKKSFGMNQQATNTINTNNNNQSCGTSSSNNSSSSGKEDATPELIKVFARRSLKIKDEDLVNLTEKILPATATPAAVLHKKSLPVVGQSNVDSDKENHSASEEKLDKISPKLDGAVTEQAINNKVSINNPPSSINLSATAATSRQKMEARNSLSDFRKNGTGHQMGLSAQNNNNHNGYQTTNGGISNNNNNNNNNNAGKTSTLPGKIYIPGRITGGIRTISGNVGDRKTLLSSSETIINHNNHNNNNNINNNNIKYNSFGTQHPNTSLERHSLSIRSVNTDSPNIVSGSKTIERSATMGEFKGIHQRRAEWEQRAKEALK